MKVNIERDVDVKQLLINLDSKSKCEPVGMAGYDVVVAKQMLRDAHDVIVQLMKVIEDGTQTNEMELHNKKDANGNILRSMDCHLEELEDNRNRFGYCVEDDYVCTHCADYEKCRKETDKIKSSGDKAEANSKPERSDCFGAYDGDIECECCDRKEACENIKDYNMDDEEDVL